MSDDVDKLIDNIKQDIINSNINIYMDACKESVKEVREGIVREWFGNDGSPISMINATKYHAHLKSYDINKVDIEVESYIDIGAYEEKPKAERWVKRHEEMGESVRNEEPKQYVLNLQLLKGIIGLPEKSERFPEKKWINKNFVKKTPLLYILNDTKLWGVLKEKLLSKFSK